LGLSLGIWWEETEYEPAQGTFSEKGAFMLAELKGHAVAKLEDVLADMALMTHYWPAFRHVPWR